MALLRHSMHLWTSRYITASRILSSALQHANGLHQACTHGQESCRSAGLAKVGRGWNAAAHKRKSRSCRPIRNEFSDGVMQGAPLCRREARLKPLRAFSGNAPSQETHEMSDEAFHKEADSVLNFLQDKFEEYVEDNDIPGGDVEQGQGVVTAKLGPYGTYVYNKQAPNHQIWLSSPISGPVRYDCINGEWIYKRDEHEMLERLQNELDAISRQIIGDD